MDQFPTKKNHISYSELKAWKECSFRHKLMYVDKIETYEDNPYADFGTIIHEAIENFINGGILDIECANKKIIECWDKKGYDSKDYIEKITAQRKENGWKYEHEKLSQWLASAKNILEDFPQFMDNTFPGWIAVKAEEELYEEIPGFDIKFKGFIDCIIKVPKSKNSKLFNYWILDWKTTGKSGWYFQKRKEFLSLLQVGLYKKFWAKKSNLPLKDVRAGYVFLKRSASPGKTCELFKVSVGPKFIENGDKIMSSMIKTVQKGLTLKNYYSCKFCPFKNTEHCSGNSW